MNAAGPSPAERLYAAVTDGDAAAPVGSDGDGTRRRGPRGGAAQLLPERDQRCLHEARRATRQPGRGAGAADRRGRRPGRPRRSARAGAPRRQPDPTVRRRRPDPRASGAQGLLGRRRADPGRCTRRDGRRRRPARGSGGRPADRRRPGAVQHRERGRLGRLRRRRRQDDPRVQARPAARLQGNRRRRPDTGRGPDPARALALRGSRGLHRPAGRRGSPLARRCAALRRDPRARRRAGRRARHALRGARRDLGVRPQPWARAVHRRPLTAARGRALGPLPGRLRPRPAQTPATCSPPW